MPVQAKPPSFYKKLIPSKDLFFLYACLSRANGCASRFVMDSFAFCAFFGNDVRKFIRKGRFCLTIEFVILAGFVYSFIRALRLAGAAVDAFFVDL